MAPIAWVRFPVAAFFISEFEIRIRNFFDPKHRRCAGRLPGGSSVGRAVDCKVQRAVIHGSGVQVSLPGSFFARTNFIFVAQRYRRENLKSSYGHTTVNAPHPIRTAKLSTVGPDQYYGRGLRGNLRCCMAKFLFLNFFLSRPKIKMKMQSHHWESHPGYLRHKQGS